MVKSEKPKRTKPKEKLSMPQPKNDVVTDCCDVCIAQQYAPRDFMDVNEFIEIDEASTHLKRNSNANAKGGAGGRKSKSSQS